jgi:acetyl esterase/lipase
MTATRSPNTRRLARWLAALATVAAPVIAQAGFFQWDMVELPASSGAACGNGSPYRFFVNRTPFSHDMVIVYEGGGACWTQDACLGIGPLSAANPNGIPPDYMHSLKTEAAYGLVTPFSSRVDPFQAAPTQSWNIVYLPYCTGDVHSGSAVRVYSDSDPSNPRVEFHRGQANIRAAAAWLRANQGRPDNLLLTGFSAGGVGATTTYALMRDTLDPKKSSQLLSDSGPLMQAPRSSTPQQSPSLPLHNTIRKAWGLDRPDGLITSFVGLPGFDDDNLGTTSTALAMRYPQDRFGFMLFQQDQNFSAFSYTDFFPFVSDPPHDGKLNWALLALWHEDIPNWMNALANVPNIGYHIAFFRNFNESHCLTIVDWSGTGIQEVGLPTIAPFVDNILQREAPPLRNFETDHVSDYTQVLSPILRFLNFIGFG